MSSIDGMDERRLAIENALSSAFADIDNDFIGWSALKNLMTTTFTDHVQVRFWFGKFRAFKNNGGDNTLPSEAPWFEDLRDEIRILLNQRVNMSDDLTRIAAINYKKHLWLKYNDFNPELFIRPMLEQNGKMYHIWGIPGSGKTDFCMKNVEIFLAYDFTVITNIYSLDAQLILFGKSVPSEQETIPNFFRTVRMSDLLFKMVSEMKLGRSIVIAIDEMSAHMHKQDSGTKSNIDFSRFIRFIRKFNGNILFMEQIDEGLASVTSEMLVAKFHKESRKKVHYMTRNQESNYNLYLESVPKTRLHFKTGDFAGFIHDINFKDMFEKINIDDQGDKTPEIEKYLGGIVMREKTSQSKMARKKGVS